MTTLKIPHWVGYLLWIGVGGCLAGVGWFLPEAPRPITSQPLTEGSRYYLTDSSGQTRLLAVAPITPLKQTPAGLQVGALTLPATQTVVGREPYWLPIVAEDWKQVMTGLLGGRSTDSARRWQTTRQQWRQFVRVELDSLSRIKGRPNFTEEQLLTAALLRRLEQLPTHGAYGQDSTLHDLTGVTSVSVQTMSDICLLAQPVAPDQSLFRRWLVGLGLLMVLAGLLFTYMSRSTPAASIEPDAEPLKVQEETPEILPVPDLEPSTSTSHEPTPDLHPAEESLLSLYLRQFYERYGDLYQYLQDIPIEPDESQKQEVRRRLVEMALHAHSLCRAYKFNPALNRVSDEPNLQLIWQNKSVGELAPGTYKSFEEGAYAFSKKHQFLQQILREMNLGHLNGALMQNIFIPPAHL